MHRRFVTALALVLALVVLVPSAALATTVKPAGGFSFTETTAPGYFVGTTTCDSAASFSESGLAFGPDGALVGGMNNHLEFGPGPFHTFTYVGYHIFNAMDGSQLYLYSELPSARCASATTATFSERWTGGFRATYDPVTYVPTCQDITVSAGRISGTIDFAASTATTNVSGAYKLVGSPHSCN